MKRRNNDVKTLAFSRPIYGVSLYGASTPELTTRLVHGISFLMVPSHQNSQHDLYMAYLYMEPPHRNSQQLKRS